MAKEAAVLKPGREKAVRNRHHWIYSGAIQSLPSFEDGEILPVKSAGGDFLGHAYFNHRTSIAGRMVGFGKRPPEECLKESLDLALALRRRLFDPAKTDAMRLVNAEGDALPGLIVDRYGDVLVVQAATAGMEKLKPFFLDLLSAALKPRAILEKSDLPSRREEGLKDFSGLLRGEPVEKIVVSEEGLSFAVDLGHGQKTGFYLDQRENRRLIGRMAAGRTVLNAFSYTGAFSVYALKGGALRADSVDSSEAALDTARENFELNGLPAAAGVFFPADVFEFLRDMPDGGYDLIILDPPAFAKKKGDIIQACRGYKEINRLAMKKIGPDGLILTCSCSHFVGEELFRQVAFEAAVEAGRRVKVLSGHRQAMDHPVNIFHPETAYLKGLLLQIE